MIFVSMHMLKPFICCDEDLDRFCSVLFVYLYFLLLIYIIVYFIIIIYFHCLNNNITLLLLNI